MYESGYRATQTALDSLIPRLARTDTLRTIAVDFGRYLVGERTAVQVQMERTVASLQDNPCDSSARERFQYLIQYVNFNGSYLHKIASSCKDTSADLRTTLTGYRR